MPRHTCLALALLFAVPMLPATSGCTVYARGPRPRATTVVVAPRRVVVARPAPPRGPTVIVTPPRPGRVIVTPGHGPRVHVRPR